MNWQDLSATPQTGARNTGSIEPRHEQGGSSGHHMHYVSEFVSAQKHTTVSNLTTEQRTQQMLPIVAK